MKEIILESTVHKEKEIVLLRFEKDLQIIKILKEGLKEFHWSRTKGSWYTKNSLDLRDNLFRLMRGIAWVDCKKLVKYKEPRKLPEKFKYMEEHKEGMMKFESYLQSRRYSLNTIKTYMDSIRTFLKFFHDTSLISIDNDSLILFNNDYILRNNYSSSFQNQVVNAVKLFYRALGYGKLDPDLIHRPKRAKELPNVLSKGEVKLILNALVNRKHKAMLSINLQLWT